MLAARMISEFGKESLGDSREPRHLNRRETDVPARLPEIDFIQRLDSRDVLVPIAIGDADVEAHGEAMVGVRRRPILQA